MTPRRALVAALALLVTLLPLTPAAAVEDVQPARVAGATRLETAANVARLAFPGGAEGAVLATSVDFADALSAAFLAGVVGQPVLLTDQDRLSPEALVALRDLSVDVVTIVGGPFAVAEEVEAELEDEGFSVERLFGQFRYDTGAAIVRQGVELADGYGRLGDERAVLVASGRSFPDALAGSVLAYDLNLPIILTEADGLPDASAALVTELDPDVAYVLGGDAVIGSTVEADLTRAGAGRTERIAGPTRIESARRIADTYVAELGGFPRAALLTRGDTYPDALVAGPLGGERGAPLLLTPSPTELGEAAEDFLSAACQSLEVLQAVGGRAALAEDVLAAGEAAAESCDAPGGGEPAATQVYDIEPMEPRTGVPGEREAFSLTRRDGQLPDDTVDLALFPFNTANVLGSGPDAFSDEDQDGTADRLGQSDQGAAVFDTLNGVDIADDRILYNAVLRDGTVSWELNADAPDKVIVVAWTDDGDGLLDIDADGTPTEPYGVGVAEWTSGEPPATRLYDVVPEVADAAPGGEIQIEVVARESGEPLPDEVALGYFPDATTDVASDDGDFFADEDGDGIADELGRTDTGEATIASVNGTAFEQRATIVYRVATGDGVQAVLRADAADAVKLVAWEDANGDGQLEVDGEGRPLEPYAVGAFSWG